jgi:CTP:molybdopterin cytidylyltransferase MocA
VHTHTRTRTRVHHAHPLEGREAKHAHASRQVAAAELAQHQRALDQKLSQLEASRDLSRVWVHVDMDAFFAAVEELANPELVRAAASGDPEQGMTSVCVRAYARARARTRVCVCVCLCVCECARTKG